MFSYQYHTDALGDDLTDEQRKRHALIHLIYTAIKIAVLILVWVFFTIILIVKTPHKLESFCVSVEPQKLYSTAITKKLTGDALEVELHGRIDTDLLENPSFATEDSKFITVFLQQVDKSSNEVVWNGSEWRVYLLQTESKTMKVVANVFKVSDSSNGDLHLAMTTTNEEAEPLFVVLDTSPIDKEKGVIYAFVLLIFLYVLIIWDITDRTFAALMTSAAAIGVLAAMGARPSIDTIVSWIDVHTLMLLFGMMIMVAILSETGVFDYIAVAAYRMSKGNAWPLIFFLSLLTAVTSAFLDNVTMVLLMVPVTIRLCEVMGLRTIPVLIIVVIFSNIGGTLTPVGDPPNVIIATNSYISGNGIDFFTFTIHMFLGVFFSTVAAFLMIYFMLRKSIAIPEDTTRRSLRALNKEMAKMMAATVLEDQMRADIAKRIEDLKEHKKKNKEAIFFKPVPNFIDTLAELEVKYKIRDIQLLIKSGIALGFAVVLFFLHSLPFMEGAKLPWIAVWGALLLLILANVEDLQIILLKVEWSTLLFFAALFIVMEAFSEMGLIQWIGDRTVMVILSVDKDNQLIVAISLLLWISAITSAFVDNIPITTMLLKLTIQLSRNKSLHLPLAPLIWALAFGACLGGNGTLIGASANVVTAGLASQHGYKISFMDFFILGFPVMLATIFVSWVYLIIAHGALSWH